LAEFGVRALVVGDDLVQMLVDEPGSIPGLGELGGLGERLAEAGAGVGDFGAGSFDAVEGFLLAGFEAVQPVFELGDQASGIGSAQVGGR
jgi:hypothetical protein